MSSIITEAIVKLQTIALAITSENIKAAPTYPVETASALPLAIAYIAEGTGQADDITTARLLMNLNVDFHVRRDSMKSAYTQLNNIIPEFLQRLAGDPTLGGTVDTVVFPVSFNVAPAQWDAVVTQMASFSIPVKFIQTPTT
jgi:hypothetical protein